MHTNQGRSQGGGSRRDEERPRNPSSGGQGGGGRDDRPRTAVPDATTLDQIIVDGNVETLVKTAEQVGRGLARNERLTTSQVRSFFGVIRQIEAQVQNETPPGTALETQELQEQTYRQLVLLKPKLAYQAARDRENRKGEGVSRLAEVLTPSIDKVGRSAKHFRHLVEFFEAILAYHKAAGGRE